MTAQPIPVLLLTGYLGSGKTTLLNRILNNRRGIRFAVIVNDIGEVNIDADLIEKGGVVAQKDDSLVALQNGCICCTLKMDLVEQLRDITRQQRFDYIVIEASGICEPAPIAQTICSIPTMGMEYMRCIATVVDALRMRDEFGSGKDLLRPNLDEDDIENLVIQQIEFCNLILLNKASEVTPHELGRIREIIRALQPKAEIIECDYCDVDFDKLLNTHAFDFDKVATSAAWIDEIENHHGDEEEEDDDDDDDDHDHHHMNSWLAIGPRLSFVPRASAGSTVNPTRVMSLSKLANRSLFAMLVSGMPRCQPMNWLNLRLRIPTCVATGMNAMETACKNSSLSVSISIAKLSRSPSICVSPSHELLNS